MTIERYEDLEALSGAAADLFTATVDACVADGRRAFIAISGGGTPKRMLELLGQPPRGEAVNWDALDLCWVDERPVGPEDEDSNFRMVREALLDHVPLEPAHIHAIHPEVGTPQHAAMAYEKELQSVLPKTDDGWPRFDLVFLGIGDDGHTASLFPHSPGLRETKQWVIANHVEKLGLERITITYPVINNAAAIVFLVSGSGKADTLKRVLEGPRDVYELPSQGIKPVDGTLTWMVDEAASPNG